MWQELDLQMTFTTPLCGGVPRHDDVVKTWVESRVATDAQFQKMVDSGLAPKTLEEIVGEHLTTTDVLDEDEEMAKMWVGFSCDARGLFVRGANVRAHLKDCASVLGPIMQAGKVPDPDKPDKSLKAMKQFKAKMTECLYVKEERLHLLDEGDKPIKKATGHRDATLNVMGNRGPRTCLKRVDYVEPCQIRATLQLLPHRKMKNEEAIGIQHVRACLEYGKVHGFNQDRSLQYGRYTYELLSE